MKSTLRNILIALAACGPLTGCRTDPSVALLQSEMRWMEDQYYALEEQYHRKCQELESCRLAHQANRTPRDDGDTRDNDRPPSSRRTNGDNDTLPLQVPRVKGLPDLQSSGASGMPSVLELPEHSGSNFGSGVQPSSYHMLADTTVTHILLNRQLTGGYDRDGFPGDDGVMVVIEPRNSAGQFVPAPGEVLIELRDPDQATPSKQSIARWKLTPQQTHAKMRKSLLGRGVHLELAWLGEPPAAGDYELAVTYTAAGQKHSAEREVRIDPPRDPSLRWTPVSDPAIITDEPFDTSEGFMVQEHSGQIGDDVGGDSRRRPLPLPAPIDEYNESLNTRTAPLPQNSSIDAPPSWSPGR